ITRQHRRLDGIIHSAGVIADNFIVKKSVEEFKRVLCPKVAGTLNLDRATRDMPLDFLVLFSSSTSVLGNLGQADYAAANGFMDHFAAYRNDLARLRQRQGHTLAINWPLWQDGGMHIDAASETLMTRSTGMVPMRTETGIAAFYQGLDAAVAQLVVLEGRLVKMRQRLLGTPASDVPGQEPAVAAVAQDAATDSGDVLSAVQKMLMGRVSDNLKVPLDDIDLDTELNDYGFDSISLTALSNQLNHHYDLDLNPTVFFEYSTLGRL
ncbi:beta-ketoacyl reductase, partial [Serratia proteamaculans]